TRGGGLPAGRRRCAASRRRRAAPPRAVAARAHRAPRGRGRRRPREPPADPARARRRARHRRPRGARGRRRARAPPPPPPPPGAAARVAIALDEPEHVALDAELASPGLVVLADAYAPGWQAFVDGERVEVMPADHVFRAIRVAPGRHRIDFRYRPIWLVPG